MSFRNKNLIPLVPALGMIVAASMLAGCSNGNAARFGVIQDGSVSQGTKVPNFTFQDDKGNVNSFEQIRGAVTLVAFPTTPSWPDCDACRSIHQLASKIARQNTPITVVSIASPNKDCQKAKSSFGACNVSGYATMVALCDSEAKIRPLYGEDAAGRFFVIDSYRRIVASGELSDIRNLERNLREAVEPAEEYVQMPDDSF